MTSLFAVRKVMWSFPGKRFSELAHGSRLPTAEELNAIVQRLLASTHRPRERLARLHAGAARERQAPGQPPS